MFTFLPKAYVADIEKEYRRRTLAVVFALAAVLSLSACVLTLPSYVALVAKKSALVSEAAKAVSSDAPSNAVLEARIADIQAKMSTLKGLAAGKPLVPAVGRVVARLVPGITLSSIILKRSDQGSIVVSGSADTRDDLVAFSKSLQGDPSFRGVGLPVSALVKSQDVGFSISIDSSF